VEFHQIKINSPEFGGIKNKPCQSGLFLA